MEEREPVTADTWVEPEGVVGAEISSDESMGARIRKRRQQLGLTLLDLADAAGLTKSFVSQVERGRNSPSIATLRSIAAALEVPMFYFFQAEQNGNPVVRAKERRQVKFAGGGLYYEFLTPDLQRNIEMIEVRMKVGRSAGEMPRAHEGEECCVVMEGSVEVELSGVPYRLEEGDSIYIGSSQPHRFRNVGSGSAVLISAISPPSF
jgi:transcriptional regulator with XRE-family HTH domain